MALAYLALGSNLGDREAHLRHAVLRCAHLGDLTDGSPIYETDPVGGPEGQDPYLNAVIALETSLGPADLLERLLAIERERGRERTERWGSRTLDVDILAYGDEVVDDAGLTIPHPRLAERPFVLIPLTDIAPAFGDASGAYGDRIRSEDYKGIRRIGGPLDVERLDWMVGIERASALEGDGPMRATAHPDWANTSRDAFGGFLATIAMRAGAWARPDWALSQITYRYLRPVPSGSPLHIDVVEERRSERSRDVAVTVEIAGTRFGSATMGFVHRNPDTVVAPSIPPIGPRSDGVRADRIIEKIGRHVGASVRSWTPVERWDLPDYVDGSSEVFRAWSPNPALGSGDRTLAASAIFMPIDAMVWRGTMQALDRLEEGRFIATPTIEITTRYAGVVDEPWYVSETSVDHIAGRTVAATVRVWGASGRYAAIGHSQNLVLGTTEPTDGV